MACGQKKQNTNEGGVHLTERTCSPYNPIIKLIVDDCLGLPIYPVTSVDAVIDEDGNTLRKLLEDLLNLIKEGNSDLDDDIENKINELLQYIANNYVNNTTYSSEQTTQNNAIETIRTLLYAISALKSTSTGHLEEYIYAKDTYGVNTDVPYIVKYINDIHDKLEELIGEGGENLSIPDIIDILLAVANFDTDFNVSEYDDKLTPSNGHINIIDLILALQEEVGNNQDNSSILGRLSALESAKVKLQALLIAVANYNDEKYINDSDFTGLGLTSSDTESVNKLIEIIYLIKNAITRIGIIEEALGLNPGGGSGSIQEQLDLLKTEAKTHAHLDERVLDQMPSTLDSNNPGNALRVSHYKTLKISEYPPTTAKFLITGDEFSYNDVVYFGLLPNKTCSNPLMDLYPFGHINLSKGLPIFYKREGIDSNYVALRDDANNQLRMGDGILNGSDIIEIHKINKEMPVLYYTEISNAPDLTFKDLYVQISDDNSNRYVLVGNVNDDNEAQNTGDINALIDAYIHAVENTSNENTFNVPAPYSPKQNLGWLTYFGSSDIVLYPCILGKIYVDSLTGNAYRYESNRMYPVAKEEVIGGNGITVTLTTEYTNADEDNNIYEGPYKLYTVNKFPNTNLCVYGLDEDADLGTLCIGTLLAKVYRYNITPLGSGRYTVGKGDISIITEAVDALLGKTSGNTDTYAATLWFNALKSDLYDMVNTFKESTEYDITAVDNSGDPDILHKYDYTFTLNAIEEYLDNLFKKEAANSEELVPKTFQEALETAAMHNNAHLSDWYFGLVMLGGSSSLRSKFYTVKERECDTECDPWYADVQNDDLPNTVVIDSEIIPRNDALYRLFIVAILDANGDGVFDINDITLFTLASLHGTWENIPPVVTVDYDQSLNIRSQETGNINGFIPIENARIGGQMFYDRTNKEWWTSDGESFIKALPEYRLQVKDGSSWISLEKDGIIIQSVLSNHISLASESEPENP